MGGYLFKTKSSKVLKVKEVYVRLLKLHVKAVANEMHGKRQIEETMQNL